MNKQDINLTLQDTEQLCRLYMECKLSVLEEKELQYVLTKLPYSTPCMNETRVLMGVALPPANKIPACRRFTLWKAAASVAVISAIGLTLFNIQYGHGTDSPAVCIAYTNGNILSEEQAILQIEADMKEAEIFLHQVAELNAQEQSKIDNLINHKPSEQ